MKKVFTRRDFLRGTTLGAAGIALGGPLMTRNALGEVPDGTVTERTSRVVLVRHAEVLDSAGNYDAQVMARMLDEAVAVLLDTPEPANAWHELLAPQDILGIKTNVWPQLPTPPELEVILAQRARMVGISEQHISIRDRGLLDDPVFPETTALINVRPLRTHHWSGIGGCLKNYIMFVREPWQWHDDSCADLGGLWKLPVCRGKTRLNILVVMQPLFHGIGPHHYDTRYVWSYNGLLVSQDPVALDALGVKLLTEKRAQFFERPPRGGTSAKHVALADTRHGVGVADLQRIELIRLGWQQDVLI